MTKLFQVSGSLHSHGCWSDYRNLNETDKFPFNLEAFVNHSVSCGRDFQAITDIMAARPDKPSFVEHRYHALLKTNNPKDALSASANENEATIYLPSGRIFYIPRSQEVLTETNFKHVLALGVQDIPGGLTPLKTLELVKSSKGYVVIDHPFMCNAWTEDELLGLYKDGLIDALEFNGGLTFPSFLDFGKFPSKKANKRVLKLEEKIPVVANDDSHCFNDIKIGACTTYSIENSSQPLVDRLFQAIKARKFQRHEQYSAFLSPVKHVFYGMKSQKKYADKGLPAA